MKLLFFVDADVAMPRDAIINLDVYRCLAPKRGWWFAVRAVPWHWLSLAYSGVAFALGAARYVAGRVARAPGRWRHP